jgi:hypothetical protein
VNKRLWSWIFLGAAAVLLIASAWFARHQLTVLTQWKTTQGRLLRIGIMNDHDTDGFLIFRIRAAFRYGVDGKEQDAEAVSYFDSPNIAVMQRIAAGYSSQSRHALRYNPAKPEEFDFGAGFNPLYLRTPLEFLAGSSGCILMFVLLWRLSQPPPLCRNCRQVLQSYFRYCPECGESISAA